MKRTLDHPAVAERLDAAGVPLSPTVLAYAVDEVAAAFQKVGAGQVVLKAGGLVHKTDEGGVVLDITSPDAAVRAADEIIDRIGEKAMPFVIQAQATGLEMLVGVRRDPQLDAVLVIGRGGVTTEIDADLARVMVPTDRTTIDRLLRTLRLWPILEGFRGHGGYDVAALTEVILAVGEMATSMPDVVELDLNPVLVSQGTGGAVAVDARIVVDEASPPPDRPRHDLTRMLNPSHIAVIGVSDDPQKIGARLFRYLDEHDYPGRLDAVHPSGGQARGHTRFNALSEVDGSPDLVCVAVPARFVADVARQAVDKQVGGVLVHSSDFAETGPEGQRAQVDLARILEDGGIPLAGPNAMGFVAPHLNLTASISGGLEGRLSPGGIGLLTSSGALGSCLATRLIGAGAGLSHWIHAGNEAGLVIADYLEWMADDRRTKAVGLLLEDIKAGPRFIAAGRRLSAAGKPMFALNMVRSEKGRTAALSHTGAMVGSYELREETIRAAGMVSVPSLQVLEDALLLATSTPLPAGNRLMAVTFSGGACSIIADEADVADIVLPDLSFETRSQVAGNVPSYAGIRNPLDVSYQMVSSPQKFQQVLSALLRQDEFDALLVQFTTNADPYAERLARAVAELRAVAEIPVYVSRFGGQHLAPRAYSVYEDEGIPVLDAPDRATRAVAAVMGAVLAGRATGFEHDR